MSSSRLARAARAWWRTAVVLLKLRVVLLLLVVAVGGAVLAADPWLARGAAWRDVLILLLTGTLAAGGASAINEYLEQDLDARMQRTRSRPLPAGQVQPAIWALLLGIGMVAAALLIAARHRAQLAWAVGAGAFVYIFIYTLALKRRTITNIVIGGAAGSAAVISGAAAVGRWDAPEAWALAALVFLWTPSHFWSLSLVYRSDYARAGFPMLPVKVTPRTAARWVAVHTLGSVLVALLMAFFPRLGWPYALLLVGPSAYYAYRTLRLLRQPTAAEAWRLFHTSNLYLAVVTVVAVATALPG